MLSGDLLVSFLTSYNYLFLYVIVHLLHCVLGFQCFKIAKNRVFFQYFKAKLVAHFTLII